MTVEPKLPLRSPLPHPSSSSWPVPEWFKGLTTCFPLVVHEPEDDLPWRIERKRGLEASYSLWIHPKDPQDHVHRHPWASSSPSSLRTQLLFLLREPPVSVDFRDWSNERAAPGGTLPALFIPAENRLVATENIRGWLDSTYPIKGKSKKYNGMPDQTTSDKALAVAQLVLGCLLPAYLASQPKPPVDLYRYFPVPPPLLIGLATPIPLALTGEGRDIDREDVIRQGIEALEAFETLLDGSDWAMGAPQPTPLDALIASHFYVISALPDASALRNSLSQRDALGRYVDRVLDFAEARKA